MAFIYCYVLKYDLFTLMGLVLRGFGFHKNGWYFWQLQAMTWGLHGNNVWKVCYFNQDVSCCFLFYLFTLWELHFIYLCILNCSIVKVRPFVLCELSIECRHRKKHSTSIFMLWHPAVEKCACLWVASLGAAHKQNSNFAHRTLLWKYWDRMWDIWQEMVEAGKP